MAGVPEKLTLERARQLALERHPRLRAALLETQAREGAAQQAAMWSNPTLSVEQEDLRRQTRSTTVLLSQNLDLSGQRAARHALAQRAGEAAQAQWLRTRAEVRAEVTAAYFDALISRHKLQAARESVELAQRAAEAAARRVAAGKIAANDESRARVVVATHRIELRSAEAADRMAWLALQVAMGEAPGSSTGGGLTLDLPPLPTVLTPDQFERRLADAPVWRLAHGEVLQAAATLELVRRSRMPELTVSLGAKRAAELGRTQAVIGVALPLPLFDRQQGAEREAAKRHEAAQAQADDQAAQLRLQALQADATLRAHVQEVQALEADVLPAAQDAYQATVRGFELGKFGMLDALDAQRTWLQARTQWLDALSKAHRAAAELEKLLGEQP